MIPHAQYHDTARILYAYENKPKQHGLVTICTGGTSDIPVAEEAAVTAELCGANVNRIYDIGVSGIHRLIDALPDIRKSMQWLQWREWKAHWHLYWQDK